MAKNGRNSSPRPSDVSDEFWIYADSPTSSPNFERTGKWTVFSNPEVHDANWEKIRGATISGELGYSAKAATAKCNPLQGASRSLLICVYTNDYENFEDLKRVLIALRHLGFMERLSYKSNNDTRARRYGKGAAMYVTQPGAVDFEDRRST